jgi:hypothetical protein
MTSCCVCIEPFTKQPHKKEAKCPYCDIKACVKCTQTYLLGTHEDPHCMGCRRGWSREVLDSILLTTWLNDTYKKHRQDILLDRERSRLPAAQILVERRKLAEGRALLRSIIIAEINALEQQLHEKRNEYYLESRRIDAYNRGIDPFESSMSEKVKEEKRIFVMSCPAPDCRGFLSTAYKCGVCDIYSCPECHELKGLDRDSAHTCDPNTVATVKAVKKDCRNCPDCGTNIFKIEGCNQMFCTNCNTPFDWISGKKIITGAIHNPHYFEYLRATNGGVMPRNPGDIPCIANLPTGWQFERQVVRRFTGGPTVAMNFLYTALNVITHIQHVEIVEQTNNAQDMDNTEANIKYLQKEYTEDRWKQVLQQREKRRTKRDEVRMRYEAFVGACVDIYGRIAQRANSIETVTRADVITMSELCQEACTQLMALSKIFNEGLMDLSKRYKCQVLQLEEEDGKLKRKYKKCVLGRVRRVKKNSDATVDFEDSNSDTEEDVASKNVLVKSNNLGK